MYVCMGQPRVYLHANRAQQIKDEQNVDEHGEKVVGRSAIGRSPDLQAGDCKGHQEATEQLEEVARGDESEEASEQKRTRRLHQRPVKRPRMQRTVEKGKGGGSLNHTHTVVRTAQASIQGLGSSRDRRTR